MIKQHECEMKKNLLQVSVQNEIRQSVCNNCFFFSFCFVLHLEKRIIRKYIIMIKNPFFVFIIHSFEVFLIFHYQNSNICVWVSTNTISISKYFRMHVLALYADGSLTHQLKMVDLNY